MDNKDKFIVIKTNIGNAGFEYSREEDTLKAHVVDVCETLQAAVSVSLKQQGVSTAIYKRVDWKVEEK